jgi:YgiT-type zinc finger domain-containing protein
MKPKKPSKNLCPMCGKGTTRFEKLDYKLKDQSGKEFIVPDLEVEICDFCGEHIFNMQAVRKARQAQGQIGKILIRLQPALQNELAVRAQKNKRSITQEVHRLLETGLRVSN